MKKRKARVVRLELWSGLRGHGLLWGIAIRTRRGEWQGFAQPAGQAEPAVWFAVDTKREAREKLLSCPRSDIWIAEQRGKT